MSESAEKPLVTKAVHFGSANFPIAERVGAKPLSVLDAPDRGEPFIIDPSGRALQHGGFDKHRVLAVGPQLTSDQLTLLRNLANDPMSYYAGRPRFKRLPPKPDFAIRLTRREVRLDMTFDLCNPSWGFHCEDQHYEAWNWVGRHLRALAKSLFPELASPSARYVWRRGAIRQLKEKHAALGYTT